MQENTGEEEAKGPSEARAIKGQQRIVKPSIQEWADHMRTHTPYRKWCPHCVRGKRKAGAHSSVQDELKETEATYDDKLKVLNEQYDVEHKKKNELSSV